MARKCGLGFFPANGLVMTGQLDQTARLERTGTYNATTGTTLGTRVVAHRIYDSFSVIQNGTAFTAGTNARYSFDSGHVVIWSSSGNGTASAPFYPAVIAGTYDTVLKNTFARIEALPWGAAVTPISTSTGSKEIIPGSQYGGTKPTEMIWLQNHEPNINTGTTYGTPAQFAGMMKHIAQLYDTWCTANSISTKHIKFAVCLSNPTGTANVNAKANSFYDVGNSNDISKTGARPMDYAGWDIYYPRTENTQNGGPVTASSSDEIAFSATSKYGACHAWTLANMPTNTMDVIPEFAIRIPTSPASGGAGPDPTWPATWFTGAITYLNANTLANGNHPVAYMCQFAASSVLSNKVQGGADNSIILDQTTQATSYQVGGVATRPTGTAFHDALITLGNPSLPSGGSAGVVPTGVGATTPTAGQTSATLSWTTNGANVSYNVYKDGTQTQTGITTGSATIFASSGALPQTHSYTVTGVGTNGAETAQSSSVNVTYPAASGSAPAVPTGLAASNVQQSTATASWNASTGATGYVVNLNSSDLAPVSVTSTALSGLTPGVSQTITVRAFNASGTSTASSGVSFTTSLNPDTTGPSVPTGLAATASSSQVLLTWTASTDTPVTGAVTSGMGTYVVQRSLSPIAGTGTTLSPPNLSSNSFLDTAPPASSSGPVTVYYTVSAVDIATNPSAFSSPLSVVIPQASLGSSPTAVLSLPTTGVTYGQLFTADGSQSVPGTGGNIVNWQFDFGDSITAGPAAVAATTHAYAQSTIVSPQLFTVTLTVTDASGQTGKTSGTVLASPQTGPNFAFSNAAMLIKGDTINADDGNIPFVAHESTLANHEQRIGINEATLAASANPDIPSRHGGALWLSMPPASASSFGLTPTTAYVYRANTFGRQFSQVALTQNNGGISATSGAFFAIYDVVGNLVSPTGALTDANSMLTGSGVRTYTFDGGPFVPPLGADNTDPNSSIPTGEFFIYFYTGTLGTTKPNVIGNAPTIANFNFLCSTSAVTPTQANVQTVPFVGTASNTPSTSLNAPATLGTISASFQTILLALLP